MLIDNNIGYNLSDDLAIKEIMNLELNKMDLASTINITRWQEFQKSNSDVKTYLTFIKGKKSLSNYFQRFIGCEDKSTSKESSLLLRNTLNKYYDEKNIDKNQRNRLNSKIYDYCKLKNKEKKEVLLEDISRIFDEEDITGFFDYANSEDKGVSEVIKYDSSVLSTLKYVSYKSDDLNIRFSKVLIDRREIKVSKDKNSITITKIPEDLKSQL